MTSIALPPLPMPYPARLNPHHARARSAAKRWALDIGILGSDESVWDEADYEAIDFARFAAYGFPDAPADELELLTEWYVLGWFIEDHIDRLTPAKATTRFAPSRLRALTPVTLTPEDTRPNTAPPSNTAPTGPKDAPAEPNSSPAPDSPPAPSNTTPGPEGTSALDGPPTADNATPGPEGAPAMDGAPAELAGTPAADGPLAPDGPAAPDSASPGPEGASAPHGLLAADGLLAPDSALPGPKGASAVDSASAELAGADGPNGPNGADGADSAVVGPEGVPDPEGACVEAEGVRVEAEGVRVEVEGAVEQGLADLWARTVPGTSAGWRRRFADAFHGAVETSAGLLEFPERAVLDPMEYLGLRREHGGPFWTARLVEHSVRAEVPERLAGTRPLRVIETSFADVVGLRDDLFRHARDARRGSSFNIVPVLAEWLGYTRQQAADLVGDLLTGRMGQLEDTVRDELPGLAAREGMTRAEVASVGAYVQALRDHIAGDLRWHRETSRYGSAEPPRVDWTRRAHRPSTARAGHFAGRPLAMPYRIRRNPHHEVCGLRSTDWARRMGLLRPNGVPGSGAWTERQFTAEDLAYIPATAFPDAPRPRLELVGQWLIFALYMDDLVVELFKRGRPLGPGDLAAAETLFARLPAFMPADRAAPVPSPLNILERCLADLWPRSAELFPDRVDGLAEYCSGHLWELFNLHQHRVPEPLDYFDWRRRSFAHTLNLTLIRAAADIRLHPALSASRQLRALDNAAMDAMLLFNDVFSARKEVELERCLSTATLPLERLLGQTRAESLRTLNDLAGVRLRRFDHIATERLPALTAKLGLDADSRRTLDRYVDALRSWLAAVHHWHHAGDRYSTRTTPRPTLGTSASRPTAVQAARTLRRTLTVAAPDPWLASLTERPPPAAAGGAPSQLNDGRLRRTVPTRTSSSGWAESA
ncbi:terpene synthase family protein [Actinomadura decatromicini]|uniref:terpene synthase family protein n=1 Tax=Actinomadura decatromicini TaxID=2604572 RepID=UPI001653277A|nr:hypothetical protein [Actinomadura decatromicini]